MIPVPFPHEEMALEKNLEMRKRAMTHLKDGGCVVVFLRISSSFGVVLGTCY